VITLEPALNGKPRVEPPAVTPTVPAAPEAARPKPKRTRSKPRPQREPEPAPSPAAAWARFGVAFTLVLSAGLNGHVNSLHAPAAWAGWCMGIAVPIIVLTLSKVAGESWKAGRKPVAWFAGGSGVALLFLSVWHCASSLALLTGSDLALAVPMAVAIDCGLVACELSVIGEPPAAR
jgi:hypothetical protein